MLGASDALVDCCFGVLSTITEAARLYFPCTLQGLCQIPPPSNQWHLQTHSHYTCIECGASSQTHPHDDVALSYLDEAPLCHSLFE